MAKGTNQPYQITLKALLAQMEKAKQIMAGIAAILLAVILVVGIVSALVVAITAKAWPVYVALPLLVYFAYPQAESLILRLAKFAFPSLWEKKEV